MGCSKLVGQPKKKNKEKPKMKRKECQKLCRMGCKAMCLRALLLLFVSVIVGLCLYGFPHPFGKCMLSLNNV